MTLKPRSEIEVKPNVPVNAQERDRMICTRVAKSLNGISIRSVSRNTGYHPETVRRYLRGESKIPADFIGQVYQAYDNIDIYKFLGLAAPVPKEAVRHIATHHLINELGHRIKLIEDTSVSNVMVREFCK